MDVENFSFRRLKQFDEELEKFEKHLREYLLQNEIERSSEIDSEIFDVYDEVRELRSSSTSQTMSWTKERNLIRVLKNGSGIS